MSRPPRGNLIITLEELKWLIHVDKGSISRRRKNLEALDSDRERETVKSLYTKLELLASQLTEPLILRASRNEARYLQKVAQEVHNRLVLSIIPGYAERVPEDPTRYGEYLKEAQEKARMLQAIVNKVKAAL